MDPPDFSQLQPGLCQPLFQFHAEVFSIQALLNMHIALVLNLPKFPVQGDCFGKRSLVFSLLAGKKVINPSFPLPSPSKKEKGSEALQL